MKGVILAAGSGTRLAPLTRHTPKPLVPVAGRLMVTYGLQALIEAGVTDLIIVVGYLGDQIRQALGETHYHSVRLIYVESPARGVGNGLSLYAARDAVGEASFILTMADHLISTRLVRRLLATRPRQDTLCVDRQPSPIVQVNEATRVWVDRMGWIKHIGKQLRHWNGLDTGVFWLTPAIFQAVEAQHAAGVSAPTLTQACRWLIEHRRGLQACDVSGRFWTDVDTLVDLRRAEYALEARGRRLFQPRLYKGSVTMTHHRERTSPHLAVIPIAGGTEGVTGPVVRLCGMPVIERLLRTLRAVGLWDVVVVAGDAEQERLQRTLKGVERLGLRVDVADLKGHVPNLGLAPNQRVLVVEGDYVLDERILRTLLAQLAECVVVYDSKPSSTQGVPVRVEDDQLQAIGAGVAADTGRYIGATVCPGRTLSPLREWVDGGWTGRLQALTHTQSIAALDVAAIDPYVPGSRRVVRPLWFRIQTPADAQRCKDALVESAQKGTLDIMAWYVHRPIENWIVRHIADLPITPNQMSVLTSLVGFAVAGLFLSGNLLPGVLAGLVVNVMDGLDGKLARVKGLTSRVGELEHSFDCLYEQAWYAGFAWGMYRLTGNLLPLVLGTVMLLCDSFSRHISMQFKQVTGVSLADYAPFDRAFRRFDGRRNTYSLHLLLTIVLGTPLVASFTMALHAAITAVVYAVRAAHHLHRADRIPLGENDAP